MTHSPLTLRDVAALRPIIDMAHNGLKVKRLVNDEIVVGIARHIVISPDNYGFPGSNDDIRDCYLRVTLISGMDVAWPVSELMADVQRGYLATVRD